MPRASRCSLLLLLVLLAGCGSTAPIVKPGTSAGSLRFQGALIDYALYVPSALKAGKPLPLMLLLHGSGGNGPAFLPMWEPVAEKYGIVLIAPTLSLTAAQETQVELLLPAILDAAAASTAIDPARTYAFGYSAGGYFAFDAGTLVSERFAGVAVFASIIAPEYTGIVKRAARKTPVALYIGDRDQFFTLDQARATRDLLTANGFPVRYVELANQDHSYARVNGQVNEDAWRFLTTGAVASRATR